MIGASRSRCRSSFVGTTRPRHSIGYCLDLAPRLPADFIRSFIVGTSDSAHQWLARLLHPTLFPEPLAPAVKAFDTRDHHRTPSDVQVSELMRGTALER